MITAQQIKERLASEKDPLGYIDAEIARRAGLMSDYCENVKGIIAIYNGRTDKDEQLDLTGIRDEFKNAGELYIELSTFLKIRKEQVRLMRRAEQLNRALAKRQESAGQKKRNV